MDTKIRIKMGPIEVEYEGSEGFLKEGLPKLIERVHELHGKTESEGGPQGTAPSVPGGTVPKSSTASIAAKLGCKSGPDLLIAAGAHFTFSKGLETFTRKQLLSEMKTAKAYYRKSYRANLTSHLNGLVKAGKLNEPSNETYCLGVETRKSLEARLAK